MKCPACSGTLAAISAGSVTLDICTTQCGGIWFDKSELERFDEHAEPVAEHILRAVKNSNAVIDRAKERFCPKCSGHKLSKSYYDSEYNVEVDECIQCGGTWLDLGELHVLRLQNKSAVERQKIADDYAKNHLAKGSVSKGVQAVFKLLFT